MTTTVGISAEFAVIRGVLLSSTPSARPEVLQSVEQRVDHGGSIVSALDALTETEPRIADVAVAYHTPQERKKIVSQLASGSWQTSSLVSIRSALFALVGGTPELDEFRTVVVLNLTDRIATAVLVGADRGQILASDSWTTQFGGDTAADGPTEVVDADPMSETIGRVRSMLASIPTHPSVIALGGSGAAEPDIAAILQDELAAPVVLLPDFADAAARGAALIAADQVHNRSAAAPKEPRSPRRAPLAAAVAAALLVASGFAVTQVLDDSSSAVGSPDTTSASPPPNSATGIEPTTDAQGPISPAGSASPSTAAPTPAPDPGQAAGVGPATGAPPATAPTPAPQWDPVEPEWVPEEPEWAPTTAANPRAPSTPASSQQEATPTGTPTPTKVGAPDQNGLFPGEAPPPPAGADPAAERAWWDNHWNLKQRWLHGR
ncbi:hypothetical protein ACFWPK_20550 [Nocardia sp. NPDC058519]|uniref:hypothetical protein n=1 Tax=Nocardia sp. NPDC058519 TaxID=3346535 RepID=UPI00364E9EC0